MAWVYFLYSKKINKYYIGACTDLDRRLYEHNLGHSKFTSTGKPWELVFKGRMGGFGFSETARNENQKDEI